MMIKSHSNDKSYALALTLFNVHSRNVIAKMLREKLFDQTLPDNVPRDKDKEDVERAPMS
ncbi:CLUMA_CG010844, isoform A [Clunio marinus]|uniref:CLUMA_CG010844, isoform A n=1 Tax=Clunio marinus TaxID=568069 RepID=A0A1J1IAZ2_9DIPT|nr:CLUMA_CG010844, isoform A [Clunio marinus]